MKRREILKTAGCTLFLPSLESFGKDRSTPDEADVKRLFCVSMGYGLFTDVLPQTDGADYVFSDHMEPLKNHRDHFTLYSKMRFGGNHQGRFFCSPEVAPLSSCQFWRRGFQIAPSSIELA